MKKILLLILIPFTTLCKEKILKLSVHTYKGQPVYMDEYNKCYIITQNCDTINVTKKLQNIVYNNKKIK
jgi:hypothetical protein